MTVEVRHPAFASVVGPLVEFEELGTGFLFTEGPLWNVAGKYLLFSDMPGDRIRRWSADGGVVEFRNPSNKSNGLTRRSRPLEEKGRESGLFSVARLSCPPSPQKIKAATIPP